VRGKESISQLAEQKKLTVNRLADQAQVAQSKEEKPGKILRSRQSRAKGGKAERHPDWTISQEEVKGIENSGFKGA